MSTISKLRNEVRALRDQVPPHPQRIHNVIKREHEDLDEVLKREGIHREEGDFLVVHDIIEWLKPVRPG